MFACYDAGDGGDDDDDDDDAFAEVKTEAAAEGAAAAAKASAASPAAGAGSASITFRDACKICVRNHRTRVFGNQHVSAQAPSELRCFPHPPCQG